MRYTKTKYKKDGDENMAVISVIIPSYNEQSNIAHTASVMEQTLSALDYELVFVDDGSRDDTYRLIQEQASRNPRIRGVKFSRNFGKEAAIFAGLQHATGDCCVVTDCDLQFPPAVILEMYALWQQGYQVVEGKKRARGKESKFYRAFAGLFYRLISLLANFDMRGSSDFKLLDRQVVDELLALPERATFFRALSFWAGFKSTAVEFVVQQRQRGQSKWSFRKLTKYAVGNITSFSTAPLQIVSVLGMMLLCCSVVLAVQTLIRFFTGRAVAGFTTVILLLLIIGGAIMISLGIIGHYIARIYDEVKGRPKYIVSETTDSNE